MDSCNDIYLEKMLEIEKHKVEILLRIADALERLAPPAKKDTNTHQKLGFVQSNIFD